jgi:hypothetical protein
VILACTLLCAPAFGAEKKKEPVPPAPLPAQILAGKTVFVSYAGINSIYLTSYIADHTGSPSGLYDEFYAAMKAWGRYELVSAPADADLVLEISLVHEGPGDTDPHFTLKILDPKTHILLWAVIEPVPAGSSFPVKRWDQALGKLVKDVRELTGESVTSAAPNK